GTGASRRSAVINRNKPRARPWSGARTSAANPRRTAHPTSIRRNLRVLHQPRPLSLIGAYEARELLGGVARGLGAEDSHFLADLAHREHAIRAGGELRHRRFRRR